MKLFPSLLVGLLISLVSAVRAEETVKVGGAVLPIAKGWTQTAQGGSVVLSPPDLPHGVACTFTLLGGEPFDGTLKSQRARLDTEWKEMEALGRVVTDDGGKIADPGGPVVTAGRSGQIETKQGVSVYVWLLAISANGRIERMVFVTTTPEAFTRYGDDVSKMINRAKWVIPKPSDVANPAAQSPGAFGHMRYSIPPGWQEKRSDGELILSPVDVPKGESLEILLMPATDAAGALSAALGRAWDDGAQQSHFTKTRTVDGTAYNTQEQKTSFKGWEYIRADGVMSASDGHDFTVNVTIIKINNRFERVLVRSRQNEQNLQRYSLYLAPAYGAAVRQFIFSLQFDDWKEPKLQPGTLKGDGIIGVWSGISMFAGKLHTAYAIFFSNEQVFFSSRFPLSGCYEFDTRIDAEDVARYWGTYEFKEGKGSLKMIYGEIPVVSKGSELVFTTNKTDHTFIRLPSVDGARINGTYAFPEWNGKIPSILFTADGHFEDHGALCLLRLETSFPFSPTSEPGGGTYVIKDYTLLLNYNDGRKYRFAFPGTGGYDQRNPSPDRLPIGYSEQELRKQ